MDNDREYLKARVKALERENSRLKDELELLKARNEVLRNDLADYLFI